MPRSFGLLFFFEFAFIVDCMAFAPSSCRLEDMVFLFHDEVPCPATRNFVLVVLLVL